MRSDEENRFIQWLNSQLNSRGKLFTSRRSKHYANNIKYAVPKLVLSKPLNACDVFGCKTLEEFDSMRQMFLNAPNYADINQKASNGAFSAGLSALRKYAEHLECLEVFTNTCNDSIVNVLESDQSFPQTTAKTNDTVDFSKSEKYAFTNPLECSIKGYLLAVKEGLNWRDLLVKTTEYFLRVNPQSVNSFVLKSGRPFITSKKFDNLKKAEYRQLSNGCLVVVSFNIPNLIRQIGRLCLHCGVSNDDIVITYKHKNHSDNRVPCFNYDQSDEKLHPAQEVIVLPKGKQLNPDDVIDLEEAKEEFNRILKTHFKQFFGYSNKYLLYEAVRITLPMFLNDNGLKDEDEVLSVAKYIYGDKYVFYDLHIWQSEPNYPRSVSGLILGFGRVKGGIFAANEAENYLIKARLSPNLTHVLRINKGKDEFVLYDDGKIMLTEHLNLSEKRVSDIFTELHKLFNEPIIQDTGFVIVRDIASEWYVRLPELEQGVEWTPLLLQEVILRFPKSGFRVIMSGLAKQSIYTIASAITIDSSIHGMFSDVVHSYLAKKSNFTLPKRMPAEDLRLTLREAGILDKNELIYNLHKALGNDHRFAFTENNQTVLIRER